MSFFLKKVNFPKKNPNQQHVRDMGCHTPGFSAHTLFSSRWIPDMFGKFQTHGSAKQRDSSCDQRYTQLPEKRAVSHPITTPSINFDSFGRQTALFTSHSASQEVSYQTPKKLLHMSWGFSTFHFFQYISLNRSQKFQGAVRRTAATVGLWEKSFSRWFISSQIQGVLTPHSISSRSSLDLGGRGSLLTVPSPWKYTKHWHIWHLFICPGIFIGWDGWWGG